MLCLQGSETTTAVTKKITRVALVSNQPQTCKKRSGEIPSTGCKCRECNHFERILKSDVIELMTFVQGHPKCELQSHVLGVRSAYILSSAASATQHQFTYKVLGTVACKAVCMEVCAVSNFVMKKLQVLAESNCAACISR